MNYIKQKPALARSAPFKNEPLSLPAPDVAVAFHAEDSLGLIPVSALGGPLTVDLFVWEAAKPRYTYGIYWNGDRTKIVKPISENDKPGDPLTLELPLDFLTEGIHSLAYEVYSPFSNTYEVSDAFPIIIDLTAPGLPELGAIQFPVEVQNGLTLAELVQMGNKIEVEIAGYTGMAKHDTIQTYWGSSIGPTTSVGQDDMGLNKIVFDFSREFLESIDTGPQLVKYTVTDQAGNVSASSLAVEITLLLEEIPEDYPAPILDPSVGDLIDYLEAKAGVKIDIPYYPAAAAGDDIILHWGSEHPMQPVKLPAGSETDDPVLSLEIPYETVALVPAGEVTITYSVERDHRLVGTSLPTVKEVFLKLPVAEPNVAPTVQGTSVENPNIDDNFIDEDDYELNGRVILAWTPDFKVSDDINLFWGAQQRIQWYQISEDDVLAAKDLIIPVPNTIMKAQGTGTEIPVHYTVTRTGNPNPTRSPTQLITVRSKESLPGGPEGLEGPPFNLNPEGYLSGWVNEDGADVKISPYINISEGQKLYFTFKGFDEDNNAIEAATFTATRVLDNVDVVDGYTFTVPPTILRTVCYGFAEASFRVEPASGSNQSAVTSKITRVPVEMRPPTQLICLI